MRNWLRGGHGKGENCSQWTAIDSAGTVLAAGLAGAAIVQVLGGLRPLNRLRDELAQLREGRRATLDDGYPSEVQPVVDELNAVLARNAEFVERARNQAGNKPGTCGEDAAERDG